jgi:diguanylate cyclase (GGDEF)-like protein
VIRIYENVRRRWDVWKEKYQRYHDEIIDYELDVQGKISMHNAVVFWCYTIVLYLLDLMIWKERGKGPLLCILISVLSIVSWIICKTFLPNHKNMVLLIADIYILVLGKTLLSTNLNCSGEVSWTLLLCALIPTALISIIPSHYIFVVTILVVTDMIEHFIVEPDMVSLLYNLIDDLIIAAFCIGINIIFTKSRYAEFERKENLYSENNRDPLTRLFNRRYMERYYAACSGVMETSAMLVIDLDNFKAVNDCYGHNMGDEVLCTVGNILRRSFREIDCVARIGGDEFAIFVPEINDMGIIAERVKEILDNFPLEIGKIPNTDVSVSIGIAFKQADEQISYERLFEKADDAMYVAKKSGKKKAVVASDRYVKGMVITSEKKMEENDKKVS